MNKWHGIGRLTEKPELRYNNNNVSYTRFSLAVNRSFANANGEREVDFINCVAWRKTAELICNYFDKGSQLGLTGRIQTGSYDDKDGNKRYTTDVVVEEIYFIGSKKENKVEQPIEQPAQIEEDPFAEFGEAVSIDDNFLD